MPTTADRKLRVFLCHSSQDKPIVRELYKRLNTEGWIDPWLDEEKLLPGQDWDMEIEKAVEAADAVIVCISSKSVSKEGYIQRELKFVLDIALEKPEGTIFIIPLRLDDCQPPRRLRGWQYADYFPKRNIEQAYFRLLASLRVRTDGLIVSTEESVFTKPETPKRPRLAVLNHSDLHIKPSVFEPTQDLSNSSVRKEADEQRKSVLWLKTILWLSLGWIFGSVINYLFDDGIYFLVIELVVGGFATGLILLKEKAISGWLSVFWITLGWAIGGMLPNFFDPFYFFKAIDWVIQGYIMWAIIWAIGGFYTSYTLLREKSVINWLSVFLITLGFATGGLINYAVGYLIAHVNNNYGWIVVGVLVSIGADTIGTKIMLSVFSSLAGVVGSVIMVWQLMKKKTLHNRIKYFQPLIEKGFRTSKDNCKSYLCL